MSPGTLWLLFVIELLLIPLYGIACESEGLPSAPNSVAEALLHHGFAPFFHLIVSIIRLLDMACVHKVREKSLVLSSDRFSREAVPVFIMTWVVARLIFFLKPTANGVSRRQPGKGRG